MLWIPLVVGMAIIVVLTLSLLRKDHPEWGILLSIAFSGMILLALLPYIEELVGVFRTMADSASIPSLYVSPVLKTIAVAYITSFGASVSRDAKEETIAITIEFAGKLVIIFIALPILHAILQVLLGLLGQEGTQ